MRQVTTRPTVADQLVLLEGQTKKVMTMVKTPKKMMEMTIKKMTQIMILQKVGDRVEGKPGVLELFHPDLPLVTGTTITIIISMVTDIIVIFIVAIIIIIVVIVIFSFQ